VFVIAMIGMLLVPSNVMKSLAVGAISVGIVSVLAALTLLPALLGKVGDGVNKLRVPWLGRNIGEASAQEGRFWGAVVRAVMRRPALYLVTFGALLIAAAIPTLGLNLGASGVSTMPDRLESKQGFEALARDFPQAGSSPALIAVVGNVRTPRVRAAIAGLRKELAADPVFGRSDLRIAPRGDLAAIGVEIGGDKTGPRALDAVRRLRSVEIPRAFRGTDARVLVGGDTADNVDFIDAMNSWLPLFLFAVLFGLSMDYQVFLLSRIKERYDERGSTTDAVTYGVSSTARLITGAALIIVAVFIGFAMGDLVMFQQMGFGVAVALLIDATIIRSVLLPAAMRLLGRWNWYLPRWLEWLPRIQIEGATAEQPVATPT
jgi:RND superfamily putative drug exporter